MHTSHAKHDAIGMGGLAAIDLNLLLALHHLLDTNNVTAAARRAGASQPSMSRTLARLRAVFADPLLVPRGRTLQPTPLARELVPQVAAALAAIHRVFDPQTQQRPAQQRFVARVAASDYTVATILRPWLVPLRAEAPGVTLRVEALDIGVIDALVRGDVDLAIAPQVRAEGVDQLVFRPLTSDPFVCALRRGHPAARGRLTMADYLKLEHVAVGNRRGNTSAVQLELQRRGHERRVAVVVPNFLAATAVVAGSDMAAVLPRSLVPASGHDLQGHPLPFVVPPLLQHLAWHPRWTTDPRHLWLREHLVASVPTGLRTATRAPARSMPQK